MYWAYTYLVWLLAISSPAFLLLHLLRRRKAPTATHKLPPGPPGLPVFGNMFQLGSMPHRTIAALKDTYGPVVWLRIGSMKTMVGQTANSAAELFKNHDANFSSRSITEVMKAHGFHEAAVSLSPYGSYWRVMKKIMTVEMIVQKQINATEEIRRRCIGDMVTWISEEAAENGKGGIQVAKFVFLSSFNMLGNLMLSRDLVSPKSVEGSEFFNAMIKLMEWSGHPNMGDLFSWLRHLDPQGLRRKMDRDMKKALDIVDGFVSERLKERKQNVVSKKDFLEVLLEQPDKISEHDLNIVIMEIFLAGSETTSSTTEWALVELLRHPAAMFAVKTELTQLIGKNNKFKESHIENLPYLQAVLKETLRLHPPIPFLVPRKASQETTFMGHHIPKDTQLFVNCWAIGRDPDCYSDPLDFKPERFLGSNLDYKGQNFELIPFGAGRRICAGIPLAHRMLHLVLGSLLHEFEWVVDETGRKGVMDDMERMGVTVRKLVSLKAIPRKSST